jgi:hypothetical protein
VTPDDWSGRPAGRASLRDVFESLARRREIRPVRVRRAVGGTGAVYAFGSLRHRRELSRGEFNVGLIHGLGLSSVGALAIAAAFASRRVSFALILSMAAVMALESAVTPSVAKRAARRGR